MHKFKDHLDYPLRTFPKELGHMVSGHFDVGPPGAPH